MIGLRMRWRVPVTVNNWVRKDNSVSRESNLVKNTAIITIGKVCTQLVSFFLLPLYTAILSTEDYGVVDLLNTLVALLLPLVTLQIDQALFRELVEVRGNKDATAKIIKTGMASVTAQCLIYFGAFVCLSPWIQNEYKYFLASNVLINAVLGVLLQIARGLGNNKSYAKASFFSASLTIMFNVVFLVGVQLGAKGMLTATFLGQMLAALYLVLSLHIVQYVKMGEYEKGMVTRLLKYSIPLIPNAISWWIIDASDRVLVSSILGVSQNGILAASLKFASLLTGLNYITTLSWTESIAVAINDEDIENYFNRMVDVFLRFYIAISMGMIACMPFVFPILVNEQYHAGYGLIPISIMATLFNVVVGLISVVYVAKKNTKAIAQTAVMAAVINISVHLLLIRYVGLYAAVLSSLVAFLSMSILRISDIRKKGYMSITINRKLITLTFVVLIGVLWAYYSSYQLAHIVAFAITVLFAILINKNTFIFILGMIANKLHRGKDV